MILHVKTTEISPQWVPTAMRPNSKYAVTDTISSMALVACCILSSMVLISSLSYSFGEKNDSAIRILNDSGNALFKELLGHLTEIGCDGIRYLRNNWASIVATFECSGHDNLTISCTITIRILHQQDFSRVVAGNLHGCALTKQFSAPALFMTGHSCLPAEILMVVGI